MGASSVVAKLKQARGCPFWEVCLRSPSSGNAIPRSQSNECRSRLRQGPQGRGTKKNSAEHTQAAGRCQDKNQNKISRFDYFFSNRFSNMRIPSPSRACDAFHSHPFLNNSGPVHLGPVRNRGSSRAGLIEIGASEWTRKLDEEIVLCCKLWPN